MNKLYGETERQIAQRVEDDTLARASAAVAAAAAERQRSETLLRQAEDLVEQARQQAAPAGEQA